MSQIEQLTKEIIDFRNERDWEQFHNSKDLAIAISTEASELLELFLWKENEDFNLDHLKDELADVIICSLMLAHKHELNISQIIRDKMAKNAKKYPVEKAKGNCKKYSEFSDT
ncbi:nucleotide pyrophosphohydrolase [Candidatus Uabimicrobium amorphum]|uniref:Nucleotide pyrophosphohydrolase n=1 Tax=Uabimicrobium amorphum TaxID=2596890 RepID=A0A5S9F3X1_UABAM|nr:nucleotide pyrophosphohydrolase [Candidatus Uabimicrobium amorphum]BBM83979.1 nucleotide pyrophosphohydrolase [Candidatus Uabimicrobium amorphum]